MKCKIILLMTTLFNFTIIFSSDQQSSTSEENPIARKEEHCAQLLETLKIRQANLTWDQLLCDDYFRYKKIYGKSWFISAHHRERPPLTEGEVANTEEHKNDTTIDDDEERPTSFSSRRFGSEIFYSPNYDPETRGFKAESQPSDQYDYD